MTIGAELLIGPISLQQFDQALRGQLQLPPNVALLHDCNFLMALLVTVVI